MRVSSRTLIAIVAFALAVGTPAVAEASRAPCAVDENGNCLTADGYSSEEGSEYVYYADGSQTCKAVWARRNFNSFFGDVFYRYYQQVNWCFRNGTIVSLARYRWAEANWPWVFDGHVSSTCSDETCSAGRAGLSQTSVYTWGQFHACVVPWAVCNYNIPWVRVTVNGYGGWGYATGG